MFEIIDDEFCAAKDIETLEQAKAFASDNVVQGANDVYIIDQSTGFIANVWTGNIIQGEAEWNDAI